MPDPLIVGALVAGGAAVATGAAITVARKRQEHERFLSGGGFTSVDWVAQAAQVAAAAAKGAITGGPEGRGVVVASGNFAPGGPGAFGPRILPGRAYATPHWGIDIVAPEGTPIYAPKAGTVLRAGVLGGYGNLVALSHPDNHSTAYAHMARIDVSAGQQVAAGQQIGTVGSTGQSRGDHLHFEVHRNALTLVGGGRQGNRINPATWLNANDIRPAGPPSVSVAALSVPYDDWTAGAGDGGATAMAGFESTGVLAVGAGIAAAGLILLFMWGGKNK